ncbi:hypothetical protein ACLOJK_007032 [Asimina triloba]
MVVVASPWPSLPAMEETLAIRYCLHGRRCRRCRASPRRPLAFAHAAVIEDEDIVPPDFHRASADRLGRRWVARLVAPSLPRLAPAESALLEEIGRSCHGVRPPSSSPRKKMGSIPDAQDQHS